ncbi:MAG TPA: portal protein, partial [Candidatus Brocadiales bacterium]|nr:portal protein [Candidatus Brocadiales bacterium]
GTNIPVPLHMIEAIKNGALTSNARWEVSVQEREQLRTAIKECYFTDQIQMQKQAQMTATESSIIFELMQRLLGPVFGRLEAQMAPMVERIFGIMLRAGEFLPIPESLDRNKLNIEYVGPLARSQRLSELNAVKQWLEQIVQIASIKPDVMDVPDFDEIVRDSSRMLNVNERYVRTKDDIVNIRASRETQRQEQQTTEEAGVAADAFAKIAKIS